MESNEIIRNEILKVVRNQLKSNKPPETKQNYKRLLKEGISKEDAKLYIAQCLTLEIFNIMKHKEQFNEKRYIENLKNLPREPFERNSGQ